MNKRKTRVTIVGNQFFINGEITYKDRYWKGNKIEGLLFNSRMVQGIFDDHIILQPKRVHELIKRVHSIKKDRYSLLVSTSYGGGTIPDSSVVKASDFVLLHDNGVSNSSKITALVEATRKVIGYPLKPIIFNEDDHFEFQSDSSNFATAVKEYASWGYFDYRLKDEGFESGFQSMPVDWGFNSERKKMFFNKLREITLE